MLIITLHYISLKNLDKTRKYILLIYKYIHTWSKTDSRFYLKCCHKYNEYFSKLIMNL